MVADQIRGHGEEERGNAELKRRVDAVQRGAHVPNVSHADRRRGVDVGLVRRRDKPGAVGV